MIGRFYAVEGVDGSGKTSALAHLKALNYPENRYMVTKEPYYKHYIDLIKATSDPYEKGLLFAADRRAHLNNIVDPALEKGLDVICDRFVGSNAVYQLLDYEDQFGEIPDHFRHWIMNIQPPLPTPEHIFYLEVDIGTAIIRCREKPSDSLDSTHETITRLGRLKQLYLGTMNTRSIVFDSNQLDPGEIADRMLQILYPV